MSENVFTDVDRDWVRRETDVHDLSVGSAFMVLERYMVKAFLDRLEAAENLAEFSITDEHDDNCASSGCRKEYTDIWRAAAGK